MPLVDDPLLGTEYTTLAPLAASALSEVVEATHRRFGRVIVKLLLVQHQGRVDLARRMAREGAVLTRLQHPHLVAVLDFGITPAGRPFVVMERLVGATFAEEVGARGRLPVPEAIGLVVDVLAGLAAAHRVGVLHRDIKPSNLFLVRPPDGPPRVKILDFGVARVHETSPLLDGTWPYEALTEPQTLVGTPRYASPEQVRGERVDLRSDVYSTALVLYFLLAGRGPWDEHHNAADAMRAQIFVAPPALSRFGVTASASLERAVARALSKSPEDRYPSARAFAEALVGVLREAPPSMRMPGRSALLEPADETPPDDRNTGLATETDWPPSETPARALRSAAERWPLVGLAWFIALGFWTVILSLFARGLGRVGGSVP